MEGVRVIISLCDKICAEYFQKENEVDSFIKPICLLLDLYIRYFVQVYHVLNRS
jgi:hypothetical protein